MPKVTFYNLPKEKVELIIQTTLDELQEKGFEKTSIAKIIEKADVSRGSFYQYFDGLADLYKYILIDVIGKRKHQYTSQTLGSMDNLEFIELIRALFVSGIEFYRDYPQLAAISMEFVLMRNSELKRKITDDSEQMSRMFFLNLIEERKRRGEIHEEVDSEVLLYLIHSLNQSFVNYFIDKTNMNFNDNGLCLALDRMLWVLEHGIKKG